jgi:hypothetical protein
VIATWAQGVLAITLNDVTVRAEPRDARQDRQSPDTLPLQLVYRLGIITVSLFAAQETLVARHACLSSCHYDSAAKGGRADLAPLY